MKIALGIGRAHFDLAFLIQITFRNSDRPDRFENQIIFFFNLVRHEPVGDPARNDDVIFGAIALFTEDGLECAAAFEDEDDLIRAAVFVILELLVCLCRPRAIRDDVLVEQNRDAPGVEIAAARNVRRFEMMMAERTIGDFLQLLHLSSFTFRTRVGGRR